MEVYMADYSVEKPAIGHDRFYFTKKFVGVISDDVFMTLDEWISRSVQQEDTDLFLQIDIEGFEYEVFLAASASLMRRFRVIVAEFHRLDHLWDRAFFNFASRAFEKILETHTCVHLHPNNARGSVKRKSLEVPLNMEFTFLRNDRIEGKRPASGFPHSLDADNVRTKPPMVLPDCWWRY